MKPPAVASADAELEYLYRQLVEYAADFLRSRSRGKREPSGILRELIPCGPVEGALIEVRYRHPRGGQVDRPGRFFTNPNRVAAAIAASCADEDFPGAKRRGKGSISPAREAAAKFAIKLVNERYIHLLPVNRRREAKLDAVMELLRKSRTRWPLGDDCI